MCWIFFSPTQALSTDIPNSQTVTPSNVLICFHLNMAIYIIDGMRSTRGICTIIYIYTSTQSIYKKHNSSIKRCTTDAPTPSQCLYLIQSSTANKQTNGSNIRCENNSMMISQSQNSRGILPLSTQHVRTNGYLWPIKET